MAGLVPAIHVFFPAPGGKDVDARHIRAKTRFALLAGHDAGDDGSHFLVLPESLTASKVANSTL